MAASTYKAPPSDINNEVFQEVTIENDTETGQTNEAQKKNDSPKLLACFFCSETVESASQMQKHVSTSHSEQFGPGVPSERLFVRKTEERKISADLKKRQFACPHCKYVCYTRTTLNRHILVYHPGENLLFANSNVKPYFPPKSLNEPISEPPERDKSLKKNTETRPQKPVKTLYPRKCGLCHRTYKSSKSFVNHKKRCAKIAGLTFPHICQKCKIRFETPQTFSSHYCVSSPYYYRRHCDVCNKTFSHAKEMNRHRRLCWGSKPKETLYPRKCPVCKVVYYSATSFSDHKSACRMLQSQNIEELPSPRYCLYCSLTFYNGVSYEGHLAKCPHRRGLSISPYSVFKVSSNQWEVETRISKRRNQKDMPTPRRFTVTRQFPQCNLPDHCFLKCLNMSCEGLCSHLYTCTCIDRSGLCKHVHRVHSLRNQDRYSLDITSEPIQCFESSEISEKDVKSEKRKAKKIEHIKDDMSFIFHGLMQELHSILEASDYTTQVHIVEALRAEIKYLKDKEAEESAVLPTEVLPVECTVEAKKTKTKSHKSKKVPIKKKRIRKKLTMITSIPDFSFTELFDLSKRPIVDVDISPQKQAKPKVSRARRFTKPIYDFDFAAKHGYYIDDYSVSRLDLKTLDTFITRKQERKLKEYCGRFARGCLSDAVIDIFMYVHLRGRDDSFLLRSKFAQMVVNSTDVRQCVVELPLVNYQNFKNIYVPCRLDEYHWILIVVQVSEKQILLLDPYTNDIDTKHSDILSKWMEVFSELLLENIYEWNPPSSLPHVTLSSINVENCGPYICFYALKIIHNGTLEGYFDINIFRIYIYDSIAENTKRIREWPPALKPKPTKPTKRKKNEPKVSTSIKKNKLSPNKSRGKTPEYSLSYTQDWENLSNYFSF